MAALEEAQARIKIAGRNINKLRYADDTTLMAEIKEELQGLFMKVKKESGGDGIPVELFQILKDDAVKVLHTTYQKTWKTQQWPQN